MSGHKSRRRGKRGEYMLRDHLRKQGWTADRVPSSGAAEGFKGDVKASHPDKPYLRRLDKSFLLFEVKNHSDTFKQIYALYDDYRVMAKDDVLAFVCPGEEKVCLCVSTSLDAVFDHPEYYTFAEQSPLFKKYGRTFNKMKGMQKLLQGESDVLVLKDDRKPFLFLRYS